jgi:predicted nucleic acid-binding protein
LGNGETEAITLCLELKADLLILDDKLARTVAESHNIKCIGTTGFANSCKAKRVNKRIKKVLFSIA